MSREREPILTSDGQTAAQAMHALIREAQRQFNAGDVEGYVETFYAPDAVFHFFPPELPQGREGAKLFYAVFIGAFPDAQFIIDDTMVDGDRMTVRYHLDMTHRGEFQGIPATGKQVTMNGITVLRFAGGKVVGRWNESNMVGLMMQLAALPAPA
jgi:predicted ester cyclase